MPRLLTSLLLLATLLAPLASPAAERASGPLKRGDALSQAAASMLADIGQATWISDGQSRHVLYVFFDPNCPYCHKVYNGLRTAVEMGEIEVRWIPIGILTTTSHGKAATLLEAKDPTAALHRNEQYFSTETGSLGGIEEEPVPRGDTVKRLDRNLALLRRSGRDAVPSLLFRDKSGKHHFIMGAPPQATLDQIVRETE
jgi:thiol:disulfide interchange protein DsbG